MLAEKEFVTPEVAEALDLWLSEMKGDKQKILEIHAEAYRFRAYISRIEPLNFVDPIKMERILERGYERIEIS
ncbi:hypothetical protein AB447_204010 [Bacillus glycinifermentans]|uniref:Uncharacterized protein n=1 Tax=Bacillus glycinifermentans TaxID=1664069 RepID=A0A0T6BN97_9BACI|nr:hypothetical protein AB447_204010 [Bacillus glycinifermentans]